MRTRTASTAVACLLLVLVSTWASAEVVRWQIDGDTREAIVHAPTQLPAGAPVPLVFAFHGFGDNMQNFQHTDVHEAWPAAVVVYPQGLVTRRGLPGWQVEQAEDNRDIRLVDTVLTSLRKTYNIDEARIYVTGFSMGGMFTYLLWAERPEVFAAFAPVAARLRPTVRPTTPMPLLHIAGMRDRLVRFADQEAAIDIAIDVNGVRASTADCGEGCVVYGQDTDTPVVTWIHPGAHTYPRGTTERIVSFFQRHSRAH